MFFQRKYLSVCLTFLIFLFSGEIFSSPENEKIKIETIKSDSISSDGKGNLFLDGNVVITSDILSFSSSKAIFNESEGLLELIGEVEIISKTIKVNASDVKANLNIRTLLTKETLINHTNVNFGSTEKIVIKASGDVELINTLLTSCSIEDPYWSLTAKNISYMKDPSNVIIKGIKLRIRDIPIFYIPFVRSNVENERKTGFLTPKLTQAKNGLDVSFPYYFNLAKNYDLTIAPRHITSRGSGIASNFRYLNKQHRGEIIASGLSSDKIFKHETGDDISRWSVSWKNKSSFSKKLSSLIDLQSTSDEYFFRDIQDNQFGATRTSYLPKKFSLIWKNNFLRVGIDLKRYQLLNPYSFDEYKLKPSLSIQSYATKNDLTWSFFASKQRFELDQPNPLRPSYQKINRLLVSPSLSFKKDLPSSDLLLTAGNTYIKHELGSSESSINSPWLEIKYSLYLDKINTSSASSLIPIMKYVYVEKGYTDHSNLIDSRIISLDYSTIFEKGRFVGFDRITKNNKIILGLEQVTKNLDKDLYYSFSIGQAFYIQETKYYQDSNVLRNRSPLVAEFKTNLKGNIWSKAMVEWDSKTKNLNFASFGFSYLGSDYKKIEIRSVYREKNENMVYIPWSDRESKTNHTEIISQWPLNKSFSFFAKLAKNNVTYKSNEILYGFEYTNCCLKWGLMHRKWLEEDYYSWLNSDYSPIQALSFGVDPSIERSKTYFFFELKNVGRFGRELSKTLTSTRLE